MLRKRVFVKTNIMQPFEYDVETSCLFELLIEANFQCTILAVINATK